jgi:hypothetical protein
MLDMKKWVLIPGIIVIVVLLFGVYFFASSENRVAAVSGSRCSVIAAGRYLTDTSKWSRWWPRDGGPGIRRGPAFAYRGISYNVEGIFYNRVRVSIAQAGSGNIEADIHLLQISNDSMLMGADCKLPGGKGPFNSMGAYHRAKLLRENLDSVISAFSHFITIGRNVYGVDIVHAMSDDSILVTLSGYTPAYPTTDYIYTLIDSVRAYVDGAGAVAHNYPMLNVASVANHQFRTMVALSVNKRLAGNSRILVKRFVPWKMIEGDVRGGAHSADRAMDQLYLFRDDYHLSIMSIPFQFLITDRRKEQDSTKWVTRVCAPIS